MRLRSVQFLTLIASVLSPIVEATSRTRNPLNTISTVRNATILTNSHRITALSHFDLTFITGDDLHVRLRLEPNHDILTSDATITYLGSDGTITTQEAVDRMGHKVFKGTTWIRKPNIGQDQWRNVGWARTVVHVDGKHPLFEGAYSIHHDSSHIQSATNYLRSRHDSDPTVEPTDAGEEYMVVWRDSDVMSNAQLAGHPDLRRGLDLPAASCQSDRLRFNSDPNHPVYVNMRRRSEMSYGAMDLGSLFGKRQSDQTTGGNSAGVNLTSTIGQPAGCPSPRKVALVGVAADCNYLQTFNSTESARNNIITQINTASSHWESSFNISLGLANLTIFNDTTCPPTPVAGTEWNQACSPNVEIQDRLNMFSAWRGALGGNWSHWTLLSTCNTGSTIGLSWLGQACVNTAMTVNSSSTGDGQTSGSQSETVSGANVVISTKGTNEWQIIAHETGHTFGAVHDCDTQTCGDPNIVNSQQCCPLSAGSCNANAQYIMNPYATEGASTFSACTVGNICSAIGRNSVNAACLTNNKEVKTITGQQCGNGIVEAGEECDCGGPAGCGGNSCCDPTTCKFTTGSVCDDSNESCCQNCQLATNGTVCRASTGPCDPQEVCSGSSPNCPADKTTPDGTGCGSGLSCTSGECTSRDQQCKTVMGSYIQGNQTHACSNSGCVISCASPEFGPGVCYGLQQNFLDGTSCGGGGRCQNGQCQGTSPGGEIKSWIEDHKGLVIGIAVAVGSFILLVVLSCLWSCCTRRSRRNKQVPKPPPGGWQGWQGGSSTSNMLQQPPPNPYTYSSPGWYGGVGNQTGGGGQWSSSQPPVPQPVHPRSGPSVRYA